MLTLADDLKPLGATLRVLNWGATSVQRRATS